MKNFIHVDVTTEDEAASVLAEYDGNAKVIAGGTDLLDILKDETMRDYPEALVNIKPIAGMDYIKEEGGILKIGSLATLANIAENDTVRSKYSALAEAADSVASPQIRNVGTLGGNLCQDVRCLYYRMPKNYFFCFRKGGSLCQAVIGDNRYNAILGGQVCFAVCPSDTAIVLTALDATLVTNKRSIPISSFYRVLRNDLDTDEIVTEVQVPEPKIGVKQAFIKFRIRKAIDFAIVSVAVAVNIEGGVVADAKIVIGGVSPVPYQAKDAGDAIKDSAISESSAEVAATAAVKDAMVLTDNAYKVNIAKALVKDALLS